MTNDQIIAALEEYDSATVALKDARKRLSSAETDIKRIVGAKHDEYWETNALVAELGRRLVANLKAST